MAVLMQMPMIGFSVGIQKTATHASTNAIISTTSQYDSKKGASLARVSANADGSFAIAINRFDPATGLPAAPITQNVKLADLQATAQALQAQLDSVNRTISDINNLGK